MTIKITCLFIAFIIIGSAFSWDERVCQNIPARSLAFSVHTDKHQNTTVRRIAWIDVPCSMRSGGEPSHTVALDITASPEAFDTFLRAISENAIINIAADADNTCLLRPYITSIRIVGYQ